VPKCSVSNKASKLWGTPVLFVTWWNLVFDFRNAISSKYIGCQFQISFIYFFFLIFYPISCVTSLNQTIVSKPNQRQLLF